MRSAEAVIADIEDAAQRTGNALGWRLLYSPPAVLRGAPVAIVALHPVGPADEPAAPTLATPPGTSAWTDEAWDGHPAGQATVQRQVRALCEWLGVAPQDTLSGVLVPFRAPDWESLHRKRTARRLGTGLWREMLDHVRPPLVVALGRPVFDEMTQVLGAGAVRTVPIGWGDKKGRIADHDGGRIVGLPDLARAPVFSRPASRSALDDLLGHPA